MTTVTITVNIATTEYPDMQEGNAQQTITLPERFVAHLDVDKTGNSFMRAFNDAVKEYDDKNYPTNPDGY